MQSYKVSIPDYDEGQSFVEASSPERAAIEKLKDLIDFGPLFETDQDALVLVVDELGRRSSFSIKPRLTFQCNRVG